MRVRFYVSNCCNTCSSTISENKMPFYWSPARFIPCRMWTLVFTRSLLTSHHPPTQTLIPVFKLHHAQRAGSTHRNMFHSVHKQSSRDMWAGYRTCRKVYCIMLNDACRVAVLNQPKHFHSIYRMANFNEQSQESRIHVAVTEVYDLRKKMEMKLFGFNCESKGCSSSRRSTSSSFSFISF